MVLKPQDRQRDVPASRNFSNFLLAGTTGTEDTLLFLIVYCGQKDQEGEQDLAVVTGQKT